MKWNDFSRLDKVLLPKPNPWPNIIWPQLFLVGDYKKKFDLDVNQTRNQTISKFI